MKEEILTGLRNGMARGESVQQAMQTLISAGYNAEDVKEAANSINTGVLSTMSLSQNKTTIKDIQNAIMPQTTQNTQQTIQTQTTPSYAPLPIQKEKKKLPRGLIIILVLLGVFLLTFGMLAIFGDQILNAFMK